MNNTMMRFGVFVCFALVLLVSGFVVAQDSGFVSCTDNPFKDGCEGIYENLRSGNEVTADEFNTFLDNAGDYVQEEIRELVLTDGFEGKEVLSKLLKEGSVSATEGEDPKLSKERLTQIFGGLLDAHAGVVEGGTSNANLVMREWVGVDFDLGDLTSDRLKGADALDVSDGRITIQVTDRDEPMVIPTKNLPDDVESMSINGNVLENKKKGGGTVEISDGTYVQKNEGGLTAKEKSRWKLEGFMLGNGKGVKDGDTVTVGFDGDGTVRINGKGKIETTGSGNFGIRRDGVGTVAFSASKGVDGSSMKIVLPDSDTVTFTGANKGVASLFDKNGENPIRMRYNGNKDLNVKPWGKGEGDAFATESSGNTLVIDSIYSGNSLETIKLSGDIKSVSGLEMELPGNVKLEGSLETVRGTAASGSVDKKTSVLWDGSVGTGRFSIDGGNVYSASQGGAAAVGTPSGSINSDEVNYAGTTIFRGEYSDTGKSAYFYDMGPGQVPVPVEQAIGVQAIDFDPNAAGVSALALGDGKSSPFYTASDGSLVYRGTDGKYYGAPQSNIVSRYGNPVSANANNFGYYASQGGCVDGTCTTTTGSYVRGGDGRCAGGVCGDFGTVSGQPVRNVLRVGAGGVRTIVGGVGNILQNRPVRNFIGNVLENQPVRSVIRGVLREQPVRTFFRNVQPVRRIFGGARNVVGGAVGVVGDVAGGAVGVVRGVGGGVRGVLGGILGGCFGGICR